MGASGYAHIDVDEIIKETDNAFLCLINDEEIWLPKTQLSDSEDYAQGDKNITISITEWIAKQKNLI